jgi:putative Mn2+ efflux pump MntP
MDAFAVSITLGTICRSRKILHSLRIALAFGFFQAAMPVLGWSGGMFFKEYIKAYDHWVAFALLSFIGAKMIYESFGIDQTEKTIKDLTGKTVLILAVATSIDALAVGVTFSFGMFGMVLTAVIIIGAITFLLSYIGFHIGNTIGHFFESGFERIGGIVLIGIGIKILIQHLF